MTMEGSERQYLMFLKYTRQYLSDVTGYTKDYLSRFASGKRELGEPFIGLCSYKLKEPVEYLFKLIEVPTEGPVPSLRPHKDADLLETIDELAARLTKAEAEQTKAEARIKALEDELKQYQ